MNCRDVFERIDALNEQYIHVWEDCCNLESPTEDKAGITCNCGVIHGGSASNTVAGTCTFTADIRFSTMKEKEQAEKIIQKVAETTHVPGCSCVLEVSCRLPMERKQKNVDMLAAVNAIFSENGLLQLKGNKRAGGSDAADITQFGIPCLDSLGVEGGNIHTPDEYAKLDSLAKSAKRIAAIAYGI